MKKTLTFFAFLLAISFFGNNLFAQKSNEREIFKTEAKNIKTSIKNDALESAINQCNLLYQKIPSMKKEIHGLKLQIAQKAKKTKTKIYTTTEKDYILVFKKKKYFFVDNEGNEMAKLGKWNDANEFDLTQSVFVSIYTDAKEKHLLDTAGNNYLLAESLSELKTKDKKCVALVLNRNKGEKYDPNKSLSIAEGQAPIKSISKDSFKELGVNLFEQTQLQVLIINEHEILEIPSEIGNLTNLVHLDLSNNKISDLPASFENLKNLNYIDLSKNNFSKKPEVLGKFTQIPFLSINISGGDDEIYTTVEGEKADFPGGYMEFQKFVANNYQYPRSARREGLEGTISIQFIVEKDGSLSNVKILRGVSSDCDAEAVRVIKKVPKWIPARIKGRAVRNRITLPIKLKLGN